MKALDDTCLPMKTVATLCIARACRTDGLCNFLLENVKQGNSANSIIVTIPDSKNGMPYTFTSIKMRFTSRKRQEVYHD